MFRRFALTAAVALALLAFSHAPALAQRPGGRVPIVVPPVGLQAINTNYYLTPYMSLNQYAYNMAVLGQAYASVPPWVYGYNPYPRVVNYGPMFNYYRPAYPASYGYGYGYNPYFAALGYYP